MASRSPLGRALGLGSAKEGSHHWMAQRISAVALCLLGVWFVGMMVSMIGAERGEIIEIMRSLLFAPLMILTLAVGYWHGVLGLQVILEDYVPNEAVRTISLILIKLAAGALAVVGIYSVLRIALTGI